MSNPNVVTALWLLQFFSTTLPILITPIIFSYLIVREPNDYLKNHFHFPKLLTILVIAVMLATMPFIEFLGNLNQKIPLTKWMVDYEQSLVNAQRAMMDMRSFWDMMYNLLFIGLLTAIVEEIFFRGCMQTIFVRWTKNTHAAIWITAILFSAFHMEFSGFIPRMFLGLLFGYFVAWSGSIWPAILAHFVNNGTIVVWEYLYQNKMTRFNPDVQQMFTNAGYIISFLITMFLLFIYWYISNKWHSLHYGEELD
jgi:membrane protease YdiL (CAAX protease family)